jgi:hypothetical protein
MHDTEEEMHVDILQQSLCLRALALAKDAGRGRLRLARMHTGGTAFWRPRDLMVLLNRLRRDGTPTWRPEEEWIHNIEVHEALNIQQTEDLTRQVVSIERDFFAELNDLHWDIRYDVDNDQTDLGGVGRSLSHILHSSRCLKKIYITFSQDTALQDLSDSSYWPRTPDLTDTSSQQFRLQPDVDKRQQAASGAWLRPSGPKLFLRLSPNCDTIDCDNRAGFMGIPIRASSSTTPCAETRRPLTYRRFLGVRPSKVSQMS